jgi:hypothetical protein
MFAANKVFTACSAMIDAAASAAADVQELNDSRRGPIVETR